MFFCFALRIGKIRMRDTRFLLYVFYKARTYVCMLVAFAKHIGFRDVRTPHMYPSSNTLEFGTFALVRASVATILPGAARF